MSQELPPTASELQEEDRDTFNGDDLKSNVAREPDFAFLFDIDGVLARGSTPLPQALELFDLIRDKKGKLKIPVAFVTNACNLSVVKAKALSKWFGEEVTPDRVIHAQSPLSVFTHWHDKFLLFVGQGPVVEIANELGFYNICTIEEIADAYPLLDMVSHENRRKVAEGYVEKDFRRVEGIILIGEPIHWESKLQLLIDLLVTNGKPDHAPSQFPEVHLPLIACNMDLVFMAEACMPRFGHGAFLLCLESLYEKITGRPLSYTTIIGKPSEITYRYAEHTVSLVSKQMGYQKPIRKLYFFGDNPEVDIIGANLYNSYLKRFRRLSGGREVCSSDLRRFRRLASVAPSRVVPDAAEFVQQTAEGMDSILVRTGVYKPTAPGEKISKPSYVHRDFERAAELVVPNLDVADCLEAAKYILKSEKYDPKAFD